MHFREVANAISKTFGRKTHYATCHNELIKDPRFVLVGRGLYALAEWGYKIGIARDVIRDVLKKEGPMSKEDIVEKVMKERYFKKNTILVNLANPKTKKTYNVKTEGLVFIGRKLGETVDLNVINLKGEGQITGGSTKTGSPMVPFVTGSIQKKVLLSKGLAFKSRFKGEKKRRTVFGNTINEKVEQVNMKIVKIDHSVNLDELFPQKKKEEKK